MNKKDFIAKLAEHLVNTNSRMSSGELATHLNRNGYRNDAGKRYKRSRGVGRLLKTTYDYFDKQGKTIEANNVAQAFVKEDGSYAY